MQTGTAANLDSVDRRVEKRIENSDKESDAKIEELRRKIRSGFYESKEVLTKIVEKMLNDIKEESK